MSNSTKKSLKNSENFFASNIFTFESWSCKAQNELTYPFPGSEPISTLKIYSDKTKSIRFAFESKVGLVRLNEDGSIAESNILGKLLAIDGKKMENYFDFFKRNGFLLPLSFDNFDTIQENELNPIIKRLHATLELMSTITDMSRTSYEKIVRLIFYHLFSPIVQIETKDGKVKYTSSKHPYSIFYDKAKEMSIDERLRDTFNNSEFSFNDNIQKGFILGADFIQKVVNDNPPCDKYSNDLFRKVFIAYCAPRENISKKNLYINDFLFHYLYEVGVIQYVDLETTTYINNEVNKDNFSPELKAAAMNVAKMIIQEEIESNLKRVRPTYDINKLEPAWKIDSLLSALYFGLFYMRPQMEIYRRCANPKCGEYFLVSVTSRKRKYCCTECMNRDIQARHRAKLKMIESRKH